jgi:hypothetical protein
MKAQQQAERLEAKIRQAVTEVVNAAPLHPTARPLPTGPTAAEDDYVQVKPTGSTRRFTPVLVAAALVVAAASGIAALRAERGPRTLVSSSLSEERLSWNWGNPRSTKSEASGRAVYQIGTSSSQVLRMLGGSESALELLSVADATWRIIEPLDPASAGQLFGAGTDRGLIVVSSGRGATVPAQAVQVGPAGEVESVLASPSFSTDPTVTTLAAHGRFALLATPDGAAVFDAEANRWFDVDFPDTGAVTRPVVAVSTSEAFVFRSNRGDRVRLIDGSITKLRPLPDGFEPVQAWGMGGGALVWGWDGNQAVAYTLTSDGTSRSFELPALPSGGAEKSARLTFVEGAPLVVAVDADARSTVFYELNTGKWREVLRTERAGSTATAVGNHLLIDGALFVDAAPA